MFRATLLSIVISLALGQDLNLLCRTWCDAKALARSECHHTSPTAIFNVAATKDCTNGVGAAAVALSEHVRNGTAPRHAHDAIPPARSRLVLLIGDAASGREPWRSLALDRHPLSTTLRI